MSLDQTLCYDNLWDAAESVEGATLWLSGLRNSGLKSILEHKGGESPSMYKDFIFVVKDRGLVPCDTEAVLSSNNATEAECALEIRDWFRNLIDEGEARILMYHWFSNQTESSLRPGETYPTLLEEAVKIENDGSLDSLETTRITFQNNSTISLPDGVDPETGKFGGYQNATIVDTRPLCDPSGGMVYVVDRPLRPVGLPKASTTSLPPLEGFCVTPIYNILRENNAIQMQAEVALTSYLNPLLESFLNPRTNITMFFPTIQETPLLDPSIIDFQKRQSYIATYVLMMMLDGGKCPDYFKDGKIVRTFLGDKTGVNISMAVEPDGDNPNELRVNLMLGNETGSAQYKATFLGNACHSTVYRLESLLVPYANIETARDTIQPPLEYVGDVPQSSSEDSYYLQDICRSGNTSGAPYETNSVGSSSSISGGALAGIIVGVCAFVVIAMMLIWWLYRRRTNQSQSIRKMSDSSGVEPCFKSTSSDEEKSIQQSDLILKETDVKFDMDPESGEPIELGRGRFGRVYQGCLLGVEMVAIKCITDDSAFNILRIPSEKASSKKSESSKGPDEMTPDMSEQGDSNASNGQIYKEISVLKSCRSQYIVSFLGAIIMPKEVRLITELMPAGDLWTALGHGIHSRKVTWYSGGIFIALDVAAGLAYLHEKKRVIHLDLKSSNILLRDSYRKIGNTYHGMYQAKISDVGLSKILPMSREYLTSLQAGGTWNWCAPEVILNYKCTAGADMYSYGVVLWEICTGEIPIRGCMRDVRVPEECPQEISDLIHACIDWNEQSPAMERPKASKAYEIIESLLRD